MIKIRKRAYCPKCGKYRKIKVELSSIKHYDVDTGKVFYADMNIGWCGCNTCLGFLKITQQEHTDIVASAIIATDRM